MIVVKPNEAEDVIADLRNCLLETMRLLKEGDPSGCSPEAQEAIARSESAIRRSMDPGATDGPSAHAKTRPDDGSHANATKQEPSAPVSPCDVVSARRFRALMRASGSMIGWTGFDRETGTRGNPEMPGMVHVGMRITPVAPETGDESSRHVGNTFLAMVEDMLALEGGRQPEHPVGSSIGDDAARWNALMRLPRIKVWPNEDPEGDHEAAPFFAEYWTYGEERPGARDDPADARRRLALVADAIIGQGRA